MYKLHSRKAQLSAVGALLVISGVVIKNSLEQLGMDNHYAKYAGMFAFILGWAIVAYSTSISDSGKISANAKTLIVFGCAGVIAGSVMMMKKLMSEGKEVSKVYPALFAGAWLILGYMSGTTMNMKIVGVLAAISVLVSMMVVLPWQRKHSVVDGPGMPLFVLGWVMLLGANALR